jgi:RNA polymerase sigma factor (sigma-70 family)
VLKSLFAQGGGQVSDREELISMENQKNERSTVILQQFLGNPKNREAFGKFAAKYQPRIKRCCQLRGLQDADADDLTATILLRFFERDVFSDFVFQTKEKFYGYLSTVVKNAVLTFVRDRGRKPDAWSVGNPDVQESLTEVTEAMVRDLETICEEDRALVQTARACVEERLEEKTRQAFHMLADEERPVDEVAQHLQMTKFAVWKVHSRVMRMIREEFQKLNSPTGEKE